MRKTNTLVRQIAEKALELATKACGPEGQLENEDEIKIQNIFDRYQYNAQLAEVVEVIIGYKPTAKQYHKGSGELLSLFKQSGSGQIYLTVTPKSHSYGYGIDATATSYVTRNANDTQATVGEAGLFLKEFIKLQDKSLIQYVQTRVSGSFGGDVLLLLA